MNHHQKSSVNAEMGISMLTANLVCVLQKHYSADAVAICMLLHQYAVPTIICRSEVRLLLPVKWDNSVARVTVKCGFDSRFTSRVNGETGKRKAQWMLEKKEVHHYLKNDA